MSFSQGLQDDCSKRRLGLFRIYKEKVNVLITGPTGVGKIWLASVLKHKACRDGY